MFHIVYLVGMITNDVLAPGCASLLATCFVSTLINILEFGTAVVSIIFSFVCAYLALTDIHMCLGMLAAWGAVQAASFILSVIYQWMLNNTIESEIVNLQRRMSSSSRRTSAFTQTSSHLSRDVHVVPSTSTFNPK